jgi:hypothetical protein
MTGLSTIIIGVAVALFLIDVVFGFPYPRAGNQPHNAPDCLPPRKTKASEFFGRELPFVYGAIGLPMLFASPGDGAFILGVALVSFTLAWLWRKTAGRRRS